MAVNGSISAEQQDNVRRIASPGHAYAPLNVLVSLKRLQIFRRTSQPENGRSPHARR
jgi:hypothetical protein